MQMRNIQRYLNKKKFDRTEANQACGLLCCCHQEAAPLPLLLRGFVPSLPATLCLFSLVTEPSQLADIVKDIPSPP